MKKIYINNTKHAIVFGSTMLLPGSNAAEEIDKSKFPQIEKMLQNGDVELTENVEKAVEKANTQKIVDEVAKAAPKDEKVKAAAKKRKEQLDELDAEAKNAENSTEVGEVSE